MAPIDHLVTSGTFSLDGGTWDVDNNVWVVGDADEVVIVDAAHDQPGALPLLADLITELWLRMQARSNKEGVIRTSSEKRIINIGAALIGRAELQNILYRIDDVARASHFESKRPA